MICRITGIKRHFSGCLFLDGRSVGRYEIKGVVNSSRGRGWLAVESPVARYRRIGGSIDRKGQPPIFRIILNKLQNSDSVRRIALYLD